MRKIHSPPLLSPQPYPPPLRPALFARADALTFPIHSPPPPLPPPPPSTRLRLRFSLPLHPLASAPASSAPSIHSPPPPLPSPRLRSLPITLPISSLTVLPPPLSLFPTHHSRGIRWSLVRAQGDRRGDEIFESQEPSHTRGAATAARCQPRAAPSHRRARPRARSDAGGGGGRSARAGSGEARGGRGGDRRAAHAARAAQVGAHPPRCTRCGAGARQRLRRC